MHKLISTIVIPPKGERSVRLVKSHKTGRSIHNVDQWTVETELVAFIELTGIIGGVCL